MPHGHLRQIPHGQKDGQGEKAHHPGQPHDKHRPQGVGQSLDRIGHFGVVMLAYGRKHLVEIARFLTHGHHGHHHGRKILGPGNRPGQPLAGADEFLDFPKLPADGRVADGADQNVDGGQHRDAARLQDGENGREPGHGRFLEQRPHNRQRQKESVPDHLALLRAAIEPHPDDHQRETADRHRPICGNGVIERQGDPGRQGQLDLGRSENLGENRHHIGEQKEEGPEKGHHHRDGVLEGGFDIRVDLMLVGNDVDEPVEHRRQGAGRLAGPHHAHVERRKNRRVPAQGLGNGHALLHLVRDGATGLAQARILGLLLQDLENLDHGQTGPEHRL